MERAPYFGKCKSKHTLPFYGMPFASCVLNRKNNIGRPSSGKADTVAYGFFFREITGQRLMTTLQDRKSKTWSVVRVSSGNFLEMYDFMVFGYYASAIGNTFFPSGNPFVSLMLSLMTFGAGFLMRLLGAIVLGAYTDVHGRRAGLILTLGLMSAGIISIACMPGYATIGLLAPLLVLMGRLRQGFSAGMELGGVSVYLSEIATPGHKGFYVSWQSASQQVAVMFAALVGVVLSIKLPPQKMLEWG
jgi:MFS transporter, MHS family, citrate/tricarballylate:H+ symporter